MAFKLKLRNFIGISFALHLSAALCLFKESRSEIKATPVEIAVIIKPQVLLTPKVKIKIRPIVMTDKKNDATLNEKAKFLSANNQDVRKQTQAKLGATFQNGRASESTSSEHSEIARPEKTATTTEHLRGVEAGLRTALNSKEFQYYAYYQQIKKQLNTYWQPEAKKKMQQLLSEKRLIASAANHQVTKMIIVLDKNGSLLNVQIVGASGITDLDTTVMDAFKQVAPFPNPPPGIIDPDGTIKIRWDFIIES